MLNKAHCSTAKQGKILRKHVNCINALLEKKQMFGAGYFGYVREAITSKRWGQKIQKVMDNRN